MPSLLWVRIKHSQPRSSQVSHGQTTGLSCCCGLAKAAHPSAKPPCRSSSQSRSAGSGSVRFQHLVMMDVLHTQGCAPLGSATISSLCVGYFTHWLHSAPCLGSGAVKELVPSWTDLSSGQTGGFVPSCPGRSPSPSPQLQNPTALCSPAGHSLGVVGTQGLSCS